MAKPTWQHNPIGQITGTPQVASGGGLAGYAWETDDTQHVVYRGTDNQIHELWQRRGKDWANGGALSLTSGGPPAAGDPACYAWEADGTQHILYRGAEGQVHELWFRQGAGWKYGNALTGLAKGPFTASDPGGWSWEKDGTQHVVYRGADNQVHELWFRQGKGWQYGGALTQSTGAMLAQGDPAGYAWEGDDTQHIVYRGTDNQIHELWQRRGKKWEHGGALSQILGAPACAGDPLCYVWDKDETQHILYVGADGHVHELWQRRGKKWAYGNALTQMAGAPPAVGQPAAYVWEGDGTQHVIYRGADGQIHELWFRQGNGWKYGGALSTITGGPAAISDPVGYAWEKDDTQHVLYVGADGLVHELWMRK
jgi:hypothetical protein